MLVVENQVLHSVKPPVCNNNRHNTLQNEIYLTVFPNLFSDDRFILKEMPKSEIQLFLEFAPKYFTYMNRCHDTAQPTLLGKIVGIYQVVFKNNTTNATLRSHLLVMENLFYNRIVTQKFDLKGSMRNRLVNPDNQDGEIVLLDENLLKSIILYRNPCPFLKTIFYYSVLRLSTICTSTFQSCSNSGNPK